MTECRLYYYSRHLLSPCSSICQVLRHINISYVSLASITIVNKQLNLSHGYILFREGNSRRGGSPPTVPSLEYKHTSPCLEYS